MSVAISDQEFVLLEETSLEDLYAQLGRAVDPQDTAVGVAQADLAALLINKHAAALAWPGWITRGINYFNQIWSSISGTVCALYSAYSSHDKDWIEKVAEAILGLINIGWGVAVLIVEIALKQGLDSLCGAD